MPKTRSPDVMLFTSPKAGSGVSRQRIPELIALLEQKGVAYQVLSDPELLSRCIRDRRQQSERQPTVIAAGGDGTLGLVASRTTSETPLLPMPLGTENLLARHFGQTNDPNQILRTMEHGTVMQIDAALANERLCLIMATAGFDAEVVRRVHLRRTGHINRLNYIGPILQTIRRFRFPPIRVITRDVNHNVIDQYDAGWAMAFNLPCYAVGLSIEPAAIRDDGLINVCAFAGRSWLAGLRYAIDIYRGKHFSRPDIHRRTVTNVRFESDQRVAYEVDGDYEGHLPLEIQMLPGRVRLLVPPQN